MRGTARRLSATAEGLNALGETPEQVDARILADVVRALRGATRGYGVAIVLRALAVLERERAARLRVEYPLSDWSIIDVAAHRMERIADLWNLDACRARAKKRAA